MQAYYNSTMFPETFMKCSNLNLKYFIYVSVSSSRVNEGSSPILSLFLTWNFQLILSQKIMMEKQKSLNSCLPRFVQLIFSMDLKSVTITFFYYCYRKVYRYQVNSRSNSHILKISLILIEDMIQVLLMSGYPLRPTPIDHLSVMSTTVISYSLWEIRQKQVRKLKSCCKPAEKLKVTENNEKKL